MVMEDIGPVAKAAVNPPAGQPTMTVAGNALGIVQMGAFTPTQDGITLPANTWTSVSSLTFATAVGRRYRLKLFIRAVNMPAPGQVNFRFLANADWIGPSINDDSWVSVGTLYTSIYQEHIFNGTGASVAYTVSMNPQGNTMGMWTTQGSYFYLEDLGPNQAPALPIPDTPPGWTPLSFINGFSNTGGGHTPCGYRKIGDMVQLRGMHSGGSSATANVTVLPAGFRPANAVLFAAIASDQPGRLQVEPDGSVHWYNANPTTSWGNLTGIQFSVTP
jgi:hypothetical protein